MAPRTNSAIWCAIPRGPVFVLGANTCVEQNTNVIELYSLIPKDAGSNQRTYYNSGIGTYARPSWRSWKWYKQVLGHKIDLAIAWCGSTGCARSSAEHDFRNFERIVLDAYRWLSETYKDGDCIFLFGISGGNFIHSFERSRLHRFLARSVSSPYAFGDDRQGAEVTLMLVIDSTYGDPVTQGRIDTQRERGADSIVSPLLDFH